jgi:hypothetical protein
LTDPLCFARHGHGGQGIRPAWVDVLIAHESEGATRRAPAGHETNETRITAR